MSQADCVSNRNTKIILTYVESILGDLEDILEGIDYPEERYEDPRDYFMNEDEWGNLETYLDIYYRAKETLGDPNFFFNCGASSARYNSWGSFRYLKRAFGSPKIAYGMVPSFNKNFNDTKEFETVIKPHKKKGKIRSTFKIKFHEDINPNNDYCSGPHILGILSSVPEAWDLDPAKVTEVMNEYNPTILLPKEFDIKCWMEGNELYIIDPEYDSKRLIGRKAKLKPAKDLKKKAIEGDICLGDDYVFLGEVSENDSRMEGIVMLEDVVKGGVKIVEKDSIWNTDYFIINVESDDVTFLNRLRFLFWAGETKEEISKGYIHTIDVSRKAVAARDEALHELKLERDNLEKRVHERTAELRETNEQLTNANQKLETALTELKKTQAELVQSEKMRSVGDLAAGIAHQIHTPMSIIGMSQKKLNNLIQKKEIQIEGLQYLPKDDFQYVKNLSKKVNDYFLENNNLDDEILEEESENMGKWLKDRNVSRPYQIAEKIVGLQLKEKDKNSLIEYVIKGEYDIVDYLITSQHIASNLKRINDATDKVFENVKSLKIFVHTQQEHSLGVNLGEGLDATIQLLQTKYKNVVFQTEYDSPTIDCYPGLLNQVWQIMLKNAAEAMNENGVIQVSTYLKDQDSIAIKISDNGIGIKDEDQARIFDPYFTTKHVGESMGLGLHLAYKIVNEHHNGKINLESKVGEGTSFEVVLPRYSNKKE